jgi:hypothetical protein
MRVPDTDTDPDAGRLELGVAALLTAPFVFWVSASYVDWIRTGLVGGMLAVTQILLSDVRLALVIGVVIAGAATLRPSVPVYRRTLVWVLVCLDVIANLIINSRLHPQ